MERERERWERILIPFLSVLSALERRRELYQSMYEHMLVCGGYTLSVRKSKWQGAKESKALLKSNKA